ncbi:MAG: PrsW family intramembrane metalloprotease [Planctomycetes bacterium]|nr:PrsW family intramembrane metalloprotease [Planctomycetota bacterium]
MIRGTNASRKRQRPEKIDMADPGNPTGQHEDPQEEYNPRVGFDLPASATPPPVETGPAYDDWSSDRFGFEEPPPIVSPTAVLLGVVAPLVAVAGGVLSAPAAMVVNTIEIQERGWWGYSLGAILVAPWVEELLKPMGVYLLAWKWPTVFTSRLFNAVLGALAGLTFAALENLWYIYGVGVDPETAAFRWKYCTLLHTTCSAIFGFGITADSMKEALGGGNTPRLSVLAPALIAMGLHALWNTAATVFAVLESF